MVAGRTVSGRSLVTGVLHLAGVLRDALLPNLAWADFERVLAPKVRGLQSLWRAAAGAQQRDAAWILFSSVTALVGNAGQSNYAAANGFMDGFAETTGAISVNWGAWNVGMYAGVAGRTSDGRGLLEPEQAMQLLHLAGASGGHTSFGIIGMDLSAHGSWLTRELSGARKDEQRKRATERAKLMATLTARDLEDVIVRITGEVLGTDEVLDEEAALQELGFDSTLSVELRRKLSEALMIQIPATLLFDYPTLRQMKRKVVDLVMGEVQLLATAPADQAVNAQQRATTAPAPQQQHRQHRAVIRGAACRFSSAKSVAELWELLYAGRDLVTLIPLERVPSGIVPEEHQAVSKWGCFMDNVKEFDAAFFSISPREAVAMDPQHRMLLECGWEAIETASCDPMSLRNMDAKTGVYVGISGSEYAAIVHEYVNPTGLATATSAGRVSYIFGLIGSAMCIDTACSSSLVALIMGCHALARAEEGAFLSYGVQALCDPSMLVSLTGAGMLSPDGRCKTFDASANGFVRGEGCGALFVAPDDRSPILTIHGFATNQDGRSNGLTAPNGPSQVRLIKEALFSAASPPNSVAMIECHGTGTSLGDPIEVQSIGEVFSSHRSAPLAAGSVKTNCGHTEAAAGVLGALKAVMCMQSGLVAKHLHLNQLNEYIGTPLMEGMRAVVPVEEIAWSAADSKRMGVSSFGFSGTNAHVIVGHEAVASVVSAQRTRREKSVAVRLSAKTETSLRGLAGQYLRALQEGHTSAEQLSWVTLTARAQLAKTFVTCAQNDRELVRVLRFVFEGSNAQHENLVVPIDASVLGAPGTTAVLRVPTYAFSNTVHWVGDTGQVSTDLLDWGQVVESRELSAKLLVGAPPFDSFDHMTFYDAGLTSFHLVTLARTTSSLLGIKLLSNSFFDFPTPAQFRAGLLAPHLSVLLPLSEAPAKLPRVRTIDSASAGRLSFPLTTFQLICNLMRAHVVEVDTAASFVFQLPRACTPETLTASLRLWQSRHESLRTKLSKEFFPKSEMEFADFRLYVDNDCVVTPVSLGHVAKISEMELAVRLWIPFEFAMPPHELFRVAYVSVEGGRMYLATQLSHLIFDGFSLMMLLEDLARCILDLNAPPPKVILQRDHVYATLASKEEAYYEDTLREYWPMADVAVNMFQRWNNVSAHQVALFAALAHMALGGLDSWYLMVVKGERPEYPIDGCAVSIVPVKVERGRGELSCEDTIDSFFSTMAANSLMSEREFFLRNYRRCSFINFFPPAAQSQASDEFRIHSVPTPKGTQNIGRRICERVFGCESDFIFHQSSSWVFMAPVKAVLVSSISSFAVGSGLRDVARRAERLWRPDANFTELARLARSELCQIEEWEDAKMGHDDQFILSQSWRERCRSAPSRFTTAALPFAWRDLERLVNGLHAKLVRESFDCSFTVVCAAASPLHASASVIAVALAGGAALLSEQPDVIAKATLVLCGHDMVARVATLGIDVINVAQIRGGHHWQLPHAYAQRRRSSDVLAWSLVESRDGCKHVKRWTSRELVHSWRALLNYPGSSQLQTHLGDDEFAPKMLALCAGIPVAVVARGVAVTRLSLVVSVFTSRQVFYGFGTGICSKASAQPLLTAYDARFNDGEAHSWACTRSEEEMVLLADNGAIRSHVERTQTGAIRHFPVARDIVMPVEEELQSDGQIAAVMRSVLTSMFELISSDPTINAVAKGLNFKLMFTLPDIEISFHLAFANDAVKAYFVDEAATANVNFQMSSDTLDGIFTQRLNVIGAAFAGQILFQGEVDKAVMLQGFLGDFARLYRQACAQSNILVEAPVPKSLMLRVVDSVIPVVGTLMQIPWRRVFSWSLFLALCVALIAIALAHRFRV